MKKFFLSLLVFIFFSISGALIAVKIASPMAESADKNWGGLMFSPGDMIIFRAVFLGVLGGLVIGFFVRKYFLRT